MPPSRPSPGRAAERCGASAPLLGSEDLVADPLVGQSTAAQTGADQLHERNRATEIDLRFRVQRNCVDVDEAGVRAGDVRGLLVPDEVSEGLKAQGAPAQRVTTFQVWTSTDDGVTWQPTTVDRDRDGYHAALPTVTGGQAVSLRVKATADGVSGIEQKIIRAYRAG